MRPNVCRIHGDPGDGDNSRLMLGDEPGEALTAGTKLVPLVSSAARAVARPTRLVMPIPRSTRCLRSASVIALPAVDVSVDEALKRREPDRSDCPDG